MSLKIEIPTSNEWHVLKGETQYGPYTYEEMIKMSQDKLLFGFDYVWSPHMESWTAMSELAEFSQDRLLRVHDQSKGSSVFKRREHQRIAVEIPVYIHDNKTLWKGKAENISEAGALILMENPLLLPGDQITLHFKKAGDSKESFNCTAEVLTKRLTKQKIEHDTNLYYAVRFNSISKDAKSELKNYIKQKLRA